jgi:hypothetical protein
MLHLIVYQRIKKIHDKKLQQAILCHRIPVDKLYLNSLE